MRRFRLVVTCEHASNTVPPGYQDLGLSQDDLGTHNCYDLGAAPVAKEVAGYFGVYPILGLWTRVLVDLNREPESPEAVPEVSFGLYVPGNFRLSTVHRAERIRRYHRPYRDRVRGEVERILAGGNQCFHLSIHSFTAEIHGTKRDGEIGVLYDPEHELEASLAGPILERLSAEGLDARPNYPYHGVEDALCTSLRREFPRDSYVGIEIELSQGWVLDDAGSERASRAIVAAIEPVLVARSRRMP